MTFLNARLQLEGGDEKPTKDQITRIFDEKVLERGMGLFKEAISKPNVTLGLDICNRLLRALGQYGKKEECLVIFRYLLNQNIPLNHHTYSNLITVYGRSGDLPSALACIKQYQDAFGSLPKHDPKYVYDYLVSACIRCGDYQAAVDVIEKTLPDIGVQPDIRSYTLLMKNLAEHGQLALAEKYFNKLKTDPNLPKPNAVVFDVFLSHYSMADEYEKAKEIFEHMCDLNIIPRYTELAAYLGATIKHQPKKVEEVLQFMLSTGQLPDIVLMENLVNHYKAHEQFDEAVKKCWDISSQLAEQNKLRLSILGKWTTIAASLLEDSRLNFHNLQTMLDFWSLHIDFSPALNGKLLNAYDRIKGRLGIQNIELSDWSINMLLRVAHSKFINERTPNEETYEPALKEFENRLFELLDEANIHQREPSVEVLNSITRRLTKYNSERLEEWTKAIERYIREPNETEIQMSRELHDMCFKHENIKPDAVIEYTKDLVAKNILIVPETMGLCIQNMGKAKHIEDAETLYEIALEMSKFWPEPVKRHSKSIARNSMLIAYSANNKIDKALEIYYKILNQGDAPNANAYASLLVTETNAKFDGAQVAIDMYDEMKRLNVKPNLYFYNVLISKLGKARKFEIVWDILNEMKENKIRPSAITYGALVSACLRVRSDERAEELIREMEASLHFQPRVGVYNSMMQFYTWDIPDRQKTLYYYERIRALDIKPTEHTWKLLIDSYALIEPYDMESAHQVFDDMKKNNVKPTPTHYASLIYSYGCKQGDLQRALDIFYSVLDYPLLPNESIYQALLESLIDAQQIDEAEKHYTQMINTYNINSTAYIENLFIRGYGQLGKWKDAEQVFNNMLDNDNKEKGRVSREPSTYEELFKAYMKSGKVEKAKEVTEMMEAKGFSKFPRNNVADLLH